MIDEKAKTALDRRLIAMDRPYEVRDWCKLLGCSKEELRMGVKPVGHSAEKAPSSTRDVFHGKRGELYQRYREGQEDQLSALGLVVNMIVLWNTLYMDGALRTRPSASRWASARLHGALAFAKGSSSADVDQAAPSASRATSKASSTFNSHIATGSNGYNV